MMLSTTTRIIQIEMTYGDYSTRNYKIPMTDEATATTAREQIAAFNEAASVSGSSIANTFISENESPVVRISSGTIIQTTEEVLYSG